MAVRAAPKKFEMMNELLERLGGISPSRICLNPPPGTATEKDLIRLQKNHGRLFELVEGTLVEKPVGLDQAYVGGNLFGPLWNYLRDRPIGRVYGADAMLAVLPGLVRLPDITFLSADQVAKHLEKREAIGRFSPTLAVEVLSPSNTEKEMERKRKEYFLGGTRLVWIVDEATRTVQVWTSPDDCVTLTEEETLDGGDVLPGFRLPLREIFVDPPKPARKRRGKKGVRD
jgi:Uma2 family endonuclease